MTLNVVAFDGHDQIVADLTSGDFQVFDQGKPQRIVSFHHNEEPPVAAPVVILFDLQNDNHTDRGQGTQEIIHALEHLESSDAVYLYLLTSVGQLSPVRALPGPQEDNPREKTPWTEHIKPLLETAIGNVYGLRVVNGGMFAAIERLDAALKPFPGRKNIIWMTHSVPAPISVGSEPYAAVIATTLDRDGITFSSVDQGNIALEKGSMLEQFAQLTGGKVYVNDIEKAVKEAVAGSSSSYLMEYDPPQADGKYHKIRVTCSRKGVRLQVKQGYYAN